MKTDFSLLLLLRPQLNPFNLISSQISSTFSSSYPFLSLLHLLRSHASTNLVRPNVGLRVMAQLLSPVSTHATKFHWAARFRSVNRCRSLPKISGRRGKWRVTAVATDSSKRESVADDYYAVLGLLPDATPQQIKKAYYNCIKACHPDLSGDDEDTTNFCMFINEVYAVLSDPIQRMIYDEIHGYALSAINPFFDDTAGKDHAFVDEFSCIGCKNCANVAPDVFRIEEDFGRARVYSQCGKPDMVQQAIDTCPVDCIHWTSAAQLSLLEDEMRRVERVNVGLMLAGMGASSDVFRMACSRWEKRQMKVLEKAKIKMRKEKGYGSSNSYWNNLWGKAKEYQSSEEEVEERSKRAAAAARRWREYSRNGADRPPTFKLPETISNED